jgi:hypothetical protein
MLWTTKKEISAKEKSILSLHIRKYSFYIFTVAQNKKAFLSKPWQKKYNVYVGIRRFL